MAEISAGSPFGPRVHPFSGYIKMHQGGDFKTPIGTGLQTNIPIELKTDQFSTSYGNYAEFTDLRPDLASRGLQVEYRMAHGDEPVGFAVGEKFAPGDVPFITGNTGLSTGPHLHLEVRVNGKVVDPQSLDPTTGKPWVANFSKEQADGAIPREGLGGVPANNQLYSGAPDPSSSSPAANTNREGITDPNQLTAQQKTIQSDINTLTTEFDRNNTTLANLDSERARLSADPEPDLARIQAIDTEKAELSKRNDAITGEIGNKTADFNKAGGAGAAPGTNGPSGVAGTAKAAAGAGGKGGGAGCVGAGLLSSVAGIAMGGLMGGLGMGINGALSNVTNALNSIPGVGQLSSAFTGAASALSGGLMSNPVFGALSQVGSNIFPGLTNVLPNVLNVAAGQLLSPLTAVLQNPLNLPSVVQMMTSKGGLSGLVQAVGNNMVGNFVGGTVMNLTNNIQVAGAFADISRMVVGGVSEGMNQTFGTGIGGIGGIARNMEGIVTYGISTLSNNIGAVAADMIATGNWDTSNLTRLMQPANIAGQIIARGLGDVTGLNVAIVNAGIPLAAIDNPLYDAQIRNILNGINNQSALDAVLQGFAVGVGITNLGQLTDIAYMMKQSANTLPVDNFQDLGKKLIELQVTQAKTFSEIGSAFLRIESARELNHIVQLPTPMHKPTGEAMLRSFGYGSGTFGEIAPADFLSSATGHVHNDTMKVMLDNHKWLYDRANAVDGYGIGVLVSYFSKCKELEAIITTGGAGGGGEGGGEGGGASLDAAILTWIDEMEVILEDIRTEAERLVEEENDPRLFNVLQNIEKAHATSTAQVLREASLWDRMGYSILEPQPMSLLTVYGSTMSLINSANKTGYGQIADIVERLATDDLYGDAIKAVMRQARNAEILGDLGVNVERFALPNSGYYRNPLALYKDTYTGNIIDPPLNVQQIYYPPDPVEQYLLERDAVLADDGIADDTLLPAQKDELWADLWWTSKLDAGTNGDGINFPIGTNENILRNLGEFAVRQAIIKNMRLFGDNSLVMIDLDRNRVPIGKLTQNGLDELNNENLIATLFDVVNRILYGKIGVTKLATPFHTDEIIYGVAELLGEVNAGTIDALQNTYLGKSVLPELLTRFANRFKPINTVFDTRMDRNDPSTYGGVGPGTDPRFND